MLCELVHWNPYCPVISHTYSCNFLHGAHPFNELSAIQINPWQSNWYQVQPY